MNNLEKLTIKGIELANRYMQLYSKHNISIVAPAFYPSRLLGMIDNFSKNGCNVIMAGGGKGQRFFENIPQYTIEQDTTGLDETQENVEKIVNAIPSDSNFGNIAIMLYSSILEGDKLWEKTLTKRFKNVNVVASNEQNITSYFEEKSNLTDILTIAGLEKYIIPNELITERKTPAELFNIYKNLRSEKGQIVVQSCGPETNEKGGGYSTIIVNNFKDFYNAIFSNEGFVKVASYIEGCSSNVSICIGNMLPDERLMGAKKGELLPDESRYSVSTLYNLLQRGQKNGLSDENIFFLTQPGTLKVVGDEHLTASTTNGVGNQLNYHFDNEILDEIYDISAKIGTLMAKCGKVGLSGIDLIIDKAGHIYINEINDRQQGPTESASLNNERNGLPGLQRIAFLQNYGNMRDEETVELMREIKIHSKEIYEESTKIPSQFYIKLVGLEERTSSKIDLQSGVYSFYQNGNGNVVWDLTSSQDEDKNIVVDLSQEETSACLSDVCLAVGQEIQKGRQILRINGISEKGSEPFCIENGISKLNPTWIPVVESLRDCISQGQYLSNLDNYEAQITTINDEIAQ